MESDECGEILPDGRDEYSSPLDIKWILSTIIQKNTHISQYRIY